MVRRWGPLAVAVASKIEAKEPSRPRDPEQIAYFFITPKL
jgi:hypothetical protein